MLVGSFLCISMACSTKCGGRKNGPLPRCNENDRNRHRSVRQSFWRKRARRGPIFRFSDRSGPAPLTARSSR
ncbi:hypothetical protein K377_06921 [Streptomyces sp. PsTaAH-137]|nr:hypothetical protein K377_06921 [Streptomyces sp. PsTaAH-137]